MCPFNILESFSHSYLIIVNIKIFERKLNKDNSLYQIL